MLWLLLAQAADTDVLHMKDGRTLAVIINSESDVAIEVELLVKGAKGQTTGAARMTVAKGDVVSIDRLSPEARAKLRARLDEFGSRKRRLAEALARIKPEKTTLGSKPALKTTGPNFEIVSTCEEAFLKEATFALEEIFTGYQSYFGLQRNKDRKVRLVLLADLREYVDFQTATFGGAVMNPAFYAPKENIVVAYNMIQKEEGSKANAQIREFNAAIEDLKKKITAEERKIDQEVKAARKSIGDQAVELRKQINAGNAANKTKLKDDINRQERELVASLKEEEKKLDAQLNEFRKACTAKIEENNAIVQKNQAVIRNQNRKMFETLFHEGFHAFVANYLYENNDKVEVPRWLNEGMAMYFEMSVVEAGELIHGGLHKELTAMLKEKVKAGAHVPLRRVLQGGPETFLIVHEKDADRSTLFYAESWALTHFLTGRVKREQLDRYVAAVLNGAEKDKAFETMLGKKVEAVEAEWLDYVKSLK